MQPRLLHPVDIKIRKIDKTFTAAWDDNAREPVGQVRRAQNPIKLRAQMKIEDTDEPMAGAVGVSEQSNGYALFLTADLHEKSITIERGDRIIEIGSGDNARAVDYYITKLRWRGHYSSAGGPTLLKAYFEDRQPAQQRP